MAKRITRFPRRSYNPTMKGFKAVKVGMYKNPATGRMELLPSNLVSRARVAFHPTTARIPGLKLK
jgi:hypothetical protein